MKTSNVIAILTAFLSVTTLWAQPAHDVYGWLRNNAYDDVSAFCKFTTTDAENLETVHQFETERVACAGAFANGYYYAYMLEVEGEISKPHSFCRMDIETGELTQLKNYSAMITLFYDMTYDYSTQTMYAIGYDENNYTPLLISVDLENGETTAHTIDNDGSKLVTLACSLEGQLYTIDENADLYQLDISTRTLTSIGYTSTRPSEYLQSMEFDHATGILHWADDGKWYTVNIENGEVNQSGYLGAVYARVVGLYIPFEIVNEGAPTAVSDLQVTPGDGGALSARLSWKNPDLNQGGESLQSLTKIEIYRNEEKVHTIDHPAIGGDETWTDATITASGKVAYRIAALNAEGENSLTADSVFIGRDVPAAPANGQGTIINANSIRLNWTAPAIGLNGGWTDATSLTYTITRLPDHRTLVENLSATEYTDETIETTDAYVYEIQAKNADGTGGSVTVGPIVNGPALALPYRCRFETEEQFLLWTVIDANNDGFSWERETTLDAAYYHYNDNGETPGDDWLISPSIRLEQDKIYRLSFKLQSYVEDEGYNEKVSVHLGTGRTVAEQTIELADYEVVSGRPFTAYRILLSNLTNGDYHISFHCHSDPDKWLLYVTDILLEEVREGCIAGVITAGDAPLSGVEVSLKDTDIKTLTDADGKYILSEIKTGTYTLYCSKIGYTAADSANINVTYGDTVTVNRTLAALPTYAISGKVLNAQNTPVEKAHIALHGYINLNTETAKDGTFSFPSVYQANGYQLSTSRYGLENDTLRFDLEQADLNLAPVILKDKALAPDHVYAGLQEGLPVIEWQEPVDLTEYRHDNGQHGGRIGSPYATEASVYGSVFRTPAQLSGMTWFTEAYPYEHKYVNVFVFDLDAEGHPTSEILFSQLEVPNTDDIWMTLEFPEAVSAPNGYMLALSYDGHVGLGLDTENADPAYPFTEQTHCFSENYTSGIFSYLEEHEIRRSCMIRGIGIPLDEIGLASAATDRRYAVWRLKAHETAQPGQWQKLTGEPLDAFSYTDKDWASLQQGMYRYAVRTFYASGVQSEAVFSSALPKDMQTAVTLSLTTNTPKNESFGAQAVLTDTAGNEYISYADENGKVTFPSLWKNHYDLSITLQGYKDYHRDGMDFTSENQYEISCLLEEYVVDPFNLEIKETDRADERLFYWNVTDHLFEDFEAHPDFAVNSPGTIGWTYIDGDGAETYGIEDVKYENATTPKAYMIFNPGKTDPNISVFDQAIRAYSGEKYLAAFPALQTVNDDFFISPELSYNSDFTFSFYAKGYTDVYGMERMNVGYATNGNRAGDFIWLNGEKPIEVPADDWVQFRYTIPAEARYVAINCVSGNAFLLMIDDVFIGKAAPDSVDINNLKLETPYEIYLDGKKVGTTKNLSYRFTHLQPGQHKAGVKTLFSSSPSDLVELAFEVTGTGNRLESLSERSILYPSPAKDYITVSGEYDYIAILDISGKEVARHRHQPQISVQNLKSGIYLVRIVSARQTDVVKLVINR